MSEVHYEEWDSKGFGPMRKACLLSGTDGIEIRTPTQEVMDDLSAKVGLLVLKDRCGGLSSDQTVSLSLTNPRGRKALALIGQLYLQAAGKFLPPGVYEEVYPQNLFGDGDDTYPVEIASPPALDPGASSRRGGAA